MIIDTICFFIFLFTVFQLAKDDYILLRKTISLDQVFNIIFLCFPITLLAARLMYIFLHPSARFFNPLVFLALPYFPGLSLIGGIIGTWIFVTIYTIHKKLPRGRLLDIFGIAFLLTFSVGIFLSGIFGIPANRLLGIEKIGESMIGIACTIFLLIQFLKGAFPEGAGSLLAIVFYCVLSLISVGFMLLTHAHILISSVILTGVLLFVSLGYVAVKVGFPKK